LTNVAGAMPLQITVFLALLRKKNPANLPGF
jgi:hypothetical protein